MYGTVARVTVKPGQDSQLLEIGEAWTRERGEQSGQLAEYVFKLENQPGEYLMVAVFSDRGAYFENATDPATDRWYRRMRETLVGDPEWNDGEVVQAAVFNGI